MGRIVSIVSSPREQGNTDTLVHKAMVGAMGLSTNTFSLYRIARMRMRGCMACEACKSRGSCIQEDELTPVLEDIRDADALIVSTPVYFGQASWAYRIFEDRMYSFLDKDLRSTLPEGKDLIIVVSYSSDREAAERIADHIRHLMVDLFRFRHVGTMIYCDHSRTTHAKDDEEACRIAESLLAFYIGYYDSSDPLGAYQQKAAQGMYASEADSLNAMYIAMGDVKENYQALACPPAMTQTWPLYIRQIDAFQEKLYADYKAALLDDALMDFSATQLLMRQPYLMLRYEILMYAVIEQQFVNLANMLTLEDDTGEQQIWVDYSMAEEIYPNLYPSMDSAVNLALSTDAGKTRLLVEVEIEGFSQKYQRTVNVGPEITYLMIKPPAMSGLTSLGSGRETQITLRVTQMDTGELLVAESKTITLHSIYDFTMLNSEFGVIEPYNLLAWLRPDAEEVLALRREAIYWLETNAGAGYSSLPGYQLAYPDGTDEPSTTVLQAMAIQGAISDIGVRYNMGPYSFGGSQRVLTPDAVIQSRSGICIETALLMASALQSAQMHAMIIITPGHAQVALETWENSGTYYLLETTMLPYNATEEETMPFARFLTADEWREYLSGDGVYVIDCDLAQTLGIRGLA